MRGGLLLVLSSLLTVSSVAVALAQTADPLIQGPPAPAPPEVIARDDQGRVTIRATRITGFQFDGKLEEPAYDSVKSFGDFMQQEPHEGQPPSRRPKCGSSSTRTTCT